MKQYSFKHHSTFKFKKKKTVPSSFSSEDERAKFNEWLGRFISGKGINGKNQKYVIVKTKKGYLNLAIENEKFNAWLDEKIKEFKELKL